MPKTSPWNNSSILCYKAISALFLLTIFICNYSFAYKISDENIKAKAKQFFSQKTQFGFQENTGQVKDSNGKFASNVLFKTESPGLTIWITTSGLTYQFIKTKEEESSDKNTKEQTPSEWHRVDMNLKGANITKENCIAEGDVTQGQLNYYLTHCKDGVLNVKTYSKITIQNIYKGIDWVIYADDRLQETALKQDFIVHPNADPNQLKLIYEGSGKLDAKNNQIHFENPFGEVSEGQLFCYQGDESNEVNSHYSVTKNFNDRFLMSDIQQPTSDNFSYEIQIQLNEYDKSQALTIDPELVWATFYGGSDHDGTLAIETDNDGNIFIAGYTFSRNFPVANTGGTAYQGVDSADADVAVLKFTNAGVLIWATYYGGDKEDRAISMCLDPNGNLFVTGFAESTDFPTLNLAGAYNQANRGGAEDAFILKFNNSGQRLWASYYGGVLSDFANAICSDRNGNIFVTGYTSSSSFPVLNPGGTSYFDGSISGDDAFILKFSNNGQRLWASYYGGGLDEIGNSICTDLNGNVFVTGSSTSSTLPLLSLSGAYNQTSNAGDTDAFILKFNNSGVRLWATYYGGALEEIGYSIFCDNFGSIFVLGKTKSSSSFPLQNPGNGAYYQTINGGGSDAFILKFVSTGQRVWSTFYGGNGDESFDSFDNIAVDECGNMYFAFNTLSTNMPLQANNCAINYYKNTHAGKNDVFLAKFSNIGTRLWTSYFGGDGNDFRSAIAIDKYNNLLVTGEWSEVVSNNMYPSLDPGAAAYFDNSHNANDDIYIAKFKPVAPTSITSQVNATGCNTNCNGSATINMQCSDPDYSYVWSNGNQTLNVTSSSNTITGLCPGTYTVSVSSGCIETAVSATFTITGSTGSLPNVSTSNSLILSCTTTSGTISANSTTPGVIYAWQGPGIFSGGNTSSPIVNAAGTYTVTVLNTSTGCSNTATVLVNSNTSLPNVTAGNPLLFTCNINSGIISASSTTPGILYSWQGPGIISGGSTSSPAVNATGTYTVTVTNTTTGCTNTASVQVSSSSSLPNVTAGNVLTLTCNTTNGTINVNSTTSGVTYTWSGPGIVSGASSTSPIVNTPGTYTAVVTDPLSGCTNTTTVAVNSNTTPPDATVGSSALLTCVTTSVSISVNSTTQNVIYSWNGPGIVSGANTTNPIVNATGAYTVTITDAFTGCTNTAIVIVNESIPVTATVSADITIIAGTSTTLAATGGGNYNWYPAKGLSCANCPDPVATTLESTTYCVAVTDTNGCSDTACVRIDVLDLCPQSSDSLIISNVFSPNGDNMNDIFFIEGWNDVCVENFSIVVYNRWGQAVFESDAFIKLWDGRTLSGIESPASTYFYIVTIKRKKAEPKIYKGAFMLVR